MTDPEAGRLRLAVALEGAGWHPAAWREPDARPAELFSAGYWTDLVTEAERGGPGVRFPPRRRVPARAIQRYGQSKSSGFRIRHLHVPSWCLHISLFN